MTPFIVVKQKNANWMPFGVHRLHTDFSKK
jgi:hypothetical protein